MAKTILLNRNKKSIPINKYEGKWVAFLDGKIVEKDETLSQLMKKLKKRKFPKKPSVMLVPRKDEGPYILVL